MGFWQKITVAMRGSQAATAASDSNMTPNTIKARSAGGRIAGPMPPNLRSIGNVTYMVPPSRAFIPDATKQGGGGPGNAGAENAGDRVQKSELDVQPSWHYESQYEYFGHARPASTPHLAGIRANDFRTLGDTLGARQ